MKKRSERKTETQLVVRWSPNTESSGTERFDWDELNCESEEEFNELSDPDQQQRVAEALSARDNQCGLCFAVADSFMSEQKP